MPESLVLRVIIIAVGAYLLLELIEHAIVPIIWLITKKAGRSPTGTSGMIGEVGVVREWHYSEGWIFVHGELWKATSDDPLVSGKKAEVLDIQGLTLKIKACSD